MVTLPVLQVLNETDRRRRCRAFQQGFEIFPGPSGERERKRAGSWFHQQPSVPLNWPSQENREQRLEKKGKEVAEGAKRGLSRLGGVPNVSGCLRAWI